MTSRLNRAAYAQLVAEDIAWLDQQQRTLERDHIRTILERAVDHEYGEPVAMPATHGDKE